MITPSPTEKQTLFSPEQRRRLGEVYRLILSWLQDDKKAIKGHGEPILPELPNHAAPSLDGAFSNDHSKGGVNG